MRYFVFAVSLLFMMSSSAGVKQNKYEEHCHAMKDIQRLILEELAEKPYTIIINDWRKMYQNQEIDFNTYRMILGYVETFAKMPELYENEQSREKLLDDLFDVCVKYSK